MYILNIVLFPLDSKCMYSFETMILTEIQSNTPEWSRIFPFPFTVIITGYWHSCFSYCFLYFFQLFHFFMHLCSSSYMIIFLQKMQNKLGYIILNFYNKWRFKLENIYLCTSFCVQLIFAAVLCCMICFQQQKILLLQNKTCE